MYLLNRMMSYGDGMNVVVSPTCHRYQVKITEIIRRVVGSQDHVTFKILSESDSTHVSWSEICEGT